MLNFKRTLSALAAGLLLLTACQTEEPDLSFPSIRLDNTEAAVGIDATSFAVSITTNRPWRVTSDVPWIAVDPDSGNGGVLPSTVTVSILENKSYDRSGHVIFDIVYDSQTFSVTQTGIGRPEDFVIYFNDFDKAAAEQGASGWPYLDKSEVWKNETGVDLSAFSYAFSGVSVRNNSNSNGTYSDYDGSGVNNLLFGGSNYFAVKNLGIKEFTNFKLSFGTEKYDNNDKTALFDPKEFLVYVSEDAQKWVPVAYEYKGTAAGRWNIAEGTFSVPSGTAKLSLYITATVASSYRMDDLKLEVSETAGEVVDFSKGVEIKVGDNGGSGGGGNTPSGASGSGTLTDPYNPAGAAAAVAGLTWTSNTEYQKTDKVYVKGKICKIASNGTFGQSGTYGNASFYLSADGNGDGEFYVFRTLYFGGEKYTSGTDIALGDEVVIYGALMNYRGNTPETVANECQIYSINGVTDGNGGTNPGGGDTPSGASGSGTLTDPYNPAGAAAAVAGLTWTSNTEYQKTDKVYVKGKICKIASNGTFGQSGTYGNASFYLSADGNGDGEFYVFRTLYFGGEKYTSGTDIALGDEVVIYGALMNYRGNTPETVANECQIYSINGVTDGNGGTNPGGGDTPSGDYTAVTVSAFLAAAESDSKVYELVGTIGGTINTTYGNFDLTDETGTVYVYGLTSTNLGYGAKNDKSYASLNLKEGDKIKVRGYRGSYTNTNTGEKKDELVYAWFVEKVSGDTPGGGTNPGGGDNPGGDVPTGNSIEWTVGSDHQTWSAATDNTYGAGYSASANGMTVSYFKYNSTSNPVAASTDHIRVYKNSRLVIKVNGKTITGVTMTCKPKSGTSNYCWDMPVADGSTAKADTDALTVTWSGETATFEADATNGQVRITGLKVTFK